MRFSAGVVAALAATPLAVLAFVQPSPQSLQGTNIHGSSSRGAFLGSSSRSNTNILRTRDVSSSWSSLDMAFRLKEGETSNIFDGPMALTKERDACGVGFIANTKSGGEICVYVHLCLCEMCLMRFMFV